MDINRSNIGVCSDQECKTHGIQNEEHPVDNVGLDVDLHVDHQNENHIDHYVFADFLNSIHIVACLLVLCLKAVASLFVDSCDVFLFHEHGVNLVEKAHEHKDEPILELGMNLEVHRIFCFVVLYQEWVINWVLVRDDVRPFVPFHFGVSILHIINIVKETVVILDCNEEGDENDE